MPRTKRSPSTKFDQVCPTSACNLDSLNVEVSEPRPLSSNFVRLALKVACFFRGPFRQAPLGRSEPKTSLVRR